MQQTPLAEIPWPFGGYSIHSSVRGQEPGTTASAQNVLNYDPQTGRRRGAQRFGFERFPDSQINGSARVQDLNHVVLSQDTSTTQTETNIRTLRGIGIVDGTVSQYSSSGLTAVTSGSGAFDSSAPVIFSTQYHDDIYYADGSNYKYYDGPTNTITAWTASAGSLPTDNSNDPRLIAAWNDRIVLSGIASDPHNWFMSAVGDPTDFDYSPATETSTQAVAGNNSQLSRCLDKINTILPVNNSLMYFGCDHSIWMMTGDPMFGGRLINVTWEVGMAWGRPWCMDRRGVIYFFGSKGGLFRMAPGGMPENISQGKIEEDLLDVNLDTHLVRLVWEDRLQHVLIFITPLTAGSATHYAYDVRSEAFWPIVFADNDYNPVAVHVLDGDSSSDRVTVIGSEDGYIRAIDYDGTDDDTSAIASHIQFGPIQGENLERFILRETQVVTATGSSDVTFSVRVGKDAQTANSASDLFTRTISAGRNRSIRQGGTGAALYCRLSNSTSSETWAFESMHYALQPTGRTRQRQFA